MISLHAVELFAFVAEQGSFAAAAHRYGLSPSTVTRHIQQLEKALNARLLTRNTRSVSLTEAGRHYLPHAQAMLEASEAGHAVLNRFSREPTGTLRVTAPLTLSTLYLSPALPGFLARYPQVRIDWQLSDEFLNLIEGGFDLAIREGPITDASVIARPLVRYRRMLVASPAFLARHGRPTQPQDLAAFNCIPYQCEPKPTTWLMQKGGKRERVVLQGNMQSNCLRTLQQLTEAAVGITWLPAEQATPLIESGKLAAVLPDWQLVEEGELDTLYAVYPQRRLLSPKVAAFLEYIIEYLQANKAPPPVRPAAS